jgi:hypothetical protein
MVCFCSPHLSGGSSTFVFCFRNLRASNAEWFFPTFRQAFQLPSSGIITLEGVLVACCVTIVLAIVLSVLRRATSSTASVRSPAMERNFSLLHGVQIGTGAHQASYTMGTRCVKLTTHLHLASTSRMPGVIPPLPHTFSWCDPVFFSVIVSERPIM